MQLNKNINRNLLKEQSFPSYNINNNEDCILHFGIGNFHRAHQALYIHEILENNKNISIIGVNLRSEETNNKMQLQDYLYSLVRISNNYKKVDILNPIKKVLFGLKHKNEIRNLIVSEKIKLITITVTEKGYHFDKNKKLNFSNQIINDLEDKELSTLIGHLSFGIIERYKKNKKKLIVLSCDNLSENGTILKNLVKQFIEKKYPKCLDWFDNNIDFPLSMVDGIVPNNNKQSEFLEKMKEWGFSANPLIKTLKGIDQIEDQHKNIENIRSTLDDETGRSIDDNYQILVTNVSVDGNKENFISQNQDKIITQLRAQKASYSGVSLDEEMTNLLKYERAYQAAAKVAQAVDEIMKTILQLV